MIIDKRLKRIVKEVSALPGRVWEVFLSLLLFAG